jgi:hypothetical protein
MPGSSVAASAILPRSPAWQVCNGRAARASSDPPRPLPAAIRESTGYLQGGTGLTHGFPAASWVLQRIRNVDYSFPADLPLSDEVKDLISSMLVAGGLRERLDANMGGAGRRAVRLGLVTSFLKGLVDEG